MKDTRVRSLGQEDPLEEEMATHSSILACGLPGTEEPGGLQSTGSQSWTRLRTHTQPRPPGKLAGEGRKVPPDEMASREESCLSQALRSGHVGQKEPVEAGNAVMVCWEPFPESCLKATAFPHL